MRCCRCSGQKRDHQDLWFSVETAPGVSTALCGTTEARSAEPPDCALPSINASSSRIRCSSSPGCGCASAAVDVAAAEGASAGGSLIGCSGAGDMIVDWSDRFGGIGRVVVDGVQAGMGCRHLKHGRRQGSQKGALDQGILCFARAAVHRNAMYVGRGIRATDIQCPQPTTH